MQLKFVAAALAVFFTATAGAAQVPQTGDVELNFSGNFHHDNDEDSQRLYGSAGWFVGGGNQVGAGLSYFHGKSDDDFTYDSEGVSVFYHYNWFMQGRDFFPYAGLSYSYYHSKSEYDQGPFSVTTSDSDYSWAPVVGMKFMLNDNVALDLNLTRTMWDNDTMSDSTDLNVGLSIFF